MSETSTMASQQHKDVEANQTKWLIYDSKEKSAVDSTTSGNPRNETRPDNNINNSGDNMYTTMSTDAHKDKYIIDSTKAQQNESPETNKESTENKSEHPISQFREIPQTPQEQLVHILEIPVTEQNEISLKELQRLCMRVPELSQRLTGPTRCRLYELLLNNEENSSIAASLNVDAKMQAAEYNFGQVDVVLTETQNEMANKLHELLSRKCEHKYEQRRLEQSPEQEHVPEECKQKDDESSSVTLKEVKGFIKRITFESGYNPLLNKEYTEALLFIASVVKNGCTNIGKEELKRFYSLFLSVQKDFLAPASSEAYEGIVVILLRLLLQYHDPELSSHFDHNKLQIGRYLLTWSRALFVRNDDYATAMEIMDWVFVLGDPLMLPFAAIAYVITHRQEFLKCTDQSDLVKTIETCTLPVSVSKDKAIDPHLVDGRTLTMIPVWSGKVLLQNAEIIYRNTPISTRRIIEFCLYPDGGSINQSTETLTKYYESAPCLPLERIDLAISFATEPHIASSTSPSLSSSSSSPPAIAKAATVKGQPTLHTSELEIEYVVIDCRSKVSFDYARLPSALCVGDIIGYDETKLNNVMERIAPCKGMHLTIFGTGRPITEEHNLMKVLAFHCVAKHFPFVSISLGGFKSVIPLSRTHAIRLLTNKNVAEHNSSFSVSQAAETTTHAVAAALSNFKDKLPNVKPDSEKVRETAEEIKEKAKEKLTAVSAWGLNMFHKMQEKINETRQQTTALASTTASAAVATATTSTKTTNTKSSMFNRDSSIQDNKHEILQGTVKPSHGVAAPQPGENALFSLGDNDEQDDDYGLITSVPTRPLRGVLLSAPQTETATLQATEQNKNVDNTAEIMSKNSLVEAKSKTSIPINNTITAAAAAATKTTIALPDVESMPIHTELLTENKVNKEDGSLIHNVPSISNDNNVDNVSKAEIVSQQQAAPKLILSNQSRQQETETIENKQAVHLKDSKAKIDYENKNNNGNNAFTDSVHDQQSQENTKEQQIEQSKKSTSESSVEMTAAEITASIDAEFEELFGDLKKTTSTK